MNRLAITEIVKGKTEYLAYPTKIKKEKEVRKWKTTNYVWKSSL